MEPRLNYVEVRELAGKLGYFCGSLIGAAPFVKHEGGNSLWNRLQDRELTLRGEFPLLDDDWKLIGRVVVETGTDGDAGFYEFAQLFLYRSLRGKQGVIPKCRVKLLFDKPEWGDVVKERVDHVRKFGLYWSRADLSDIIPTDWFVKSSGSNIYKPVSASEIKG